MGQILNTFTGAEVTPNTRPEIYNSEDSPLLNVATISSPSRVEKVNLERVDYFSKSMADQINKQRAQYSPALTVDDLEKYIIDITIETSVQGSGILTVTILDPWWKLLQRHGTQQVSFIDVDSNGFLWPPIRVNFPPDVSDATWRLCSCQPSTDLTQANITLVFEDEVVAQLREHDSTTDPTAATSMTNETRAEYIRRLVKTASKNKLVAGDVGIRFIPLLPTSAFTSADLTTDETTLPTSAKVVNTHPARKDANKNGSGGDALGKKLVKEAQNTDNVLSIGLTDNLWPGGQAPAPFANG